MIKKKKLIPDTICRRTFVYNSAIAGMYWHFFANQMALGSTPDILLPGNFIAAGAKDGGKLDPVNLKNFVSFINPLTMQKRSILLPNDVHSIQQHPIKKNTIITLSKEESNSNVVRNFNAKHDISLLPAASGNVFSGHGVFSPDGQLFLTSETDPATETGEIIVRDSSTLKIKNRFQSGGVYPHEMHFLDGGKVLAVANGGFKFKNSNLSFLDPATGKVLEVKNPAVEGPGVRHFVHDDSGQFILGTWNRYDTDESKLAPIAEMLFGKTDVKELIVISPSSDQKQLYKMPASQFLSVFFHKGTRQAVLTATSAAVVIVINIDTKKVNAVLKKSNPTGICQSSEPNHVWIGDAKGFIQTLDLTTCSWVESASFADTNLEGSHFTAVKVS